MFKSCNKDVDMSDCKSDQFFSCSPNCGHILQEWFVVIGATTGGGSFCVVGTT